MRQAAVEMACCGALMAAAVAVSAPAAEAKGSQTLHSDVKNCAAAGPDEMIQVFEQAVRRNEALKRSGQPETREDVRFQEETVMPCYRKAGGMLAAADHPALMVQLLEMVASFTNSADETIPGRLWEIFKKNPCAIERALQHFSSGKQRIIVNGLESGEQLNDPRQASREALGLLKQLTQNPGYVEPRCMEARG